MTAPTRRQTAIQGVPRRRVVRVSLPGRTTRRNNPGERTSRRSAVTTRARTPEANVVPPMEIEPERALADLLRVLIAHDDCDAGGWCTGCLDANLHRPYPCPVRVHLEHVVDVVAARLGVTPF